MKLSTFLLPAALLLSSVAPARAVVLRGVVIEVRDGQSVVVLSGGRKFTVVLRGVDAPELAQDFGEASRQHLAYLVLDKTVEIDFSQLEGDHVVGKVICNQLDMGLQVVRDGAAWHDKANRKSLSEAEWNVYMAAEQLAREEARGLWQDGTPMPPWEWRRAQASKNSFQPVYKSGNGRGLSSEDLAFARRASSPNSLSGAANSAMMPKPTAKPFNTPGQDADYRNYLTQGRVSIVYFYANWCPACRRITPLMEELNLRIPDMQVLFMDIGDWGTPVAQQNGVSFVPYLKIYDKNGSLVADGKSARAWLAEAMAQRK